MYTLNESTAVLELLQNFWKIAIALWVIFIFSTAFIANNKGYNVPVWTLLAVFSGVFALVVVVSLPDKEAIERQSAAARKADERRQNEIVAALDKIDTELVAIRQVLAEKPATTDQS